MRERGWCDRNGGGEVDMRGGGSILRWQQGAPRGPSKAASRITSSSFSHSLQAPVEGIIASLSLSAGQTVEKFFAKSYLGTKILLEVSPQDNISSYWRSVRECLGGGSLIWLIIERTCWIQLAIAAWVSMSRDWICWMNVSFLSHCRHRGMTQSQVCECISVYVFLFNSNYFNNRLMSLSIFQAKMPKIRSCFAIVTICCFSLFHIFMN